MKAIIICAGEGTRWNNHTGVPKHLIEIEGEALVHRTARQLFERGVTDIKIIVKEEDERYNSPVAETKVVKINYDDNADADKFLSSKEYWGRDERTLVLYGDVYFSEKAMDTIVSYDKREWTLFAREKASKLTGTRWGECFAQSFYPEHIEKHERKLKLIATLKKQQAISRCGGWEHYRAMTGQSDLDKHVVTTNFVEINDFTEDFDTPEDYRNWKIGWNAIHRDTI